MEKKPCPITRRDFYEIPITTKMSHIQVSLMKELCKQWKCTKSEFIRTAVDNLINEEFNHPYKY